jgi:hypothetical protein
MNINDLTLGQLKEIQSLTGKTNNIDGPFKIGEKYLIRTVTHYYTGRCIAIYPQEITLDEAAWIPDTGRLYDVLKDGNKINEVEPIIGPVILGRGAIVDALLWKHALPQSQK